MQADNLRYEKNLLWQALQSTQLETWIFLKEGCSVTERKFRRERWLFVKNVEYHCCITQIQDIDRRLLYKTINSQAVPWVSWTGFPQKWGSSVCPRPSRTAQWPSARNVELLPHLNRCPSLDMTCSTHRCSY